MKSSIRHGLSLAAREHIASGQPITRLEAIVLYGVANLPDIVKEMRRRGWIVRSRSVPYLTAVTRLNKHASLTPPTNLPTRQIMLTEYWTTK